MATLNKINTRRRNSSRMFQRVTFIPGKFQLKSSVMMAQAMSGFYRYGDHSISSRWQHEASELSIHLQEGWRIRSYWGINVLSVTEEMGMKLQPSCWYRWYYWSCGSFFYYYGAHTGIGTYRFVYGDEAKKIKVSSKTSEGEWAAMLLFDGQNADWCELADKTKATCQQDGKTICSMVKKRRCGSQFGFCDLFSFR